MVFFCSIKFTKKETTLLYRLSKPQAPFGFYVFDKALVYKKFYKKKKPNGA